MKQQKQSYQAVLMFIIILFTYNTPVFSQVGIRTQTPKSTLDIIADPETDRAAGMQAPRLTLADLTGKGNSLYGADQKGTIVYITAITGGGNTGQRANITAIGYYYFDGSLWQKLNPFSDLYRPGDVVNSFRTADHDGWYLLDGRAITSLSANAQAIATSLGFTANLPNATDRVLKAKTGTEALGSTGGANSQTIAQVNLPNVTMTGTMIGTSSSEGSHNHTYSATSTSVGHSHTLSATSGSTGHVHSISLTSTNTAHTHTYGSVNSSSNGAHTHTFQVPARGTFSHVGANSGYWSLTSTQTATTSSNGAHTHSYTGTAASAGAAHTHTLSGTSVTSAGAAHTHTYSATSSSAGAAHTHAYSGTSASGGTAHTHTYSGTGYLPLGNGTALDNRSAYLAVNTFIYLGF